MPLCKYAKFKHKEVLNISEHSDFKYSWSVIHLVYPPLFFEVQRATKTGFELPFPSFQGFRIPFVMLQFRWE